MANYTLIKVKYAINPAEREKILKAYAEVSKRKALVINSDMMDIVEPPTRKKVVKKNRNI